MSTLSAKIGKNLRHYSERGLVALRAARWDRTTPVAQRPVFVISGSRSGTQMLYKTISLSPAVGSVDREIYAVWDRRGVGQPPVAGAQWLAHARAGRRRRL
jgi:hypothetical protein